jgi:hypothetical protein
VNDFFRFAQPKAYHNRNRNAVDVNRDAAFRAPDASGALSVGSGAKATEKQRNENCPHDESIESDQHVITESLASHIAFAVKLRESSE